MTPSEKVRVLCLDDEPNVVAGLALHLRRRYDVVTATHGDEALAHLRGDPSIAVVLSDMRMPGMDGVHFLSVARRLAPDAMRMLLTGQADLTAAAAAVNQGQIFRFLTKPCSPATLLSAFEAAVAQHVVTVTERVLLEETLRGSIKALLDVLALTNPVCFGRASRIKQLCDELSERLAIAERWQIDVAAMLSQLAFITLPGETVERIYFGRPLTEAEQVMIARLPAVTEQLLANIPRLEIVRAMLARQERPHHATAPPAPLADDAHEALVEQGAQLLRVAMDFDQLETQGHAPPAALAILRGRDGRYDERVLDALATGRCGVGSRDRIREVPLNGLQAGMVLAEDLRMSNGMMLVARGYEVTSSFIERLANVRASLTRDRVLIRVPPE